MVDVPILKVFISSPADVRPERLIAERAVRRLATEFVYHFRIEPVLWEREPLVASAHFQESLVAPNETEIVVVILWSRLGVLLPLDKFAGPLSRKPVTGTEWEFEDALKSARERKAPDLLVYRKRAPISAVLDDEDALQRQLVQKRLVEDFMQRWFVDAETIAFTAAFREFGDAAAFEEMLEEHLRELIRKRLPRGERADAPGVRWHDGSPFRGLLAFDLEHAALFFGRRQARNELRELLVRQIARGVAFVLVVGASGSGKSSLVKAGLLSDLALRGMIGDVALVRHAEMRPSHGDGDLVASLANALIAPSALPELAEAGYDAASFAALLGEAPTQAITPLVRALRTAGERAGLTTKGRARLVLIVDQLEEIFTIEPAGEPQRERFIAALEALAHSGAVWVVATMRSDFFDRLETTPRLLALSAGEARYVLAPPSGAEILQMVREPAREAGLAYAFDAERGVGLDEIIHEEAARDPAALPLLSFLLDQLWRRRSATGELTLEAYRELGGLAGALGRRAEEVFAAQTPAVQAELPALLRTLARVGPGGKISARSAPLSQFRRGEPTRKLIDAMLAADGRLLTADDSGGEARVRVAHEALLSHWLRARQQLAADARDLEAAGLLESQAERWSASTDRGRNSLLLASGLALDQAVDLVRRWGVALPVGVLGYVIRSRRAARRRRIVLALALAGATLSLPAIAGVVWAALVWRGVRTVEAEMPFENLPAGCFVMGTPLDEPGRFAHEAQHRVCVGRFELGRYAVTQAEWRLVMVERGDPARYKGDRRPVEMVSWEDARAFARRMSWFGARAYRLPTEAEWEYAVRAGGAQSTTWFWGNRIEDGCTYANLRDKTYHKLHFDVDEAIVDCEDGYDYTAPVGTFKPNGFGLYDMTGNLFQWTEDCFGSYDKAPTDGTAAEAIACAERVVRGGSWNSRPRFTRSGSRDVYPPENRNDVVGFRLAR